jgi:hypothetical protein
VHHVVVLLFDLVLGNYDPEERSDHFDCRQQLLERDAESANTWMTRETVDIVLASGYNRCFTSMNALAGLLNVKEIRRVVSAMCSLTRPFTFGVAQPTVA